jgi:hypothetical protein
VKGDLTQNSLGTPGPDNVLGNETEEMYVPSDENSIDHHFGGTEHKAATRLSVLQHRRSQSTTDKITQKSTEEYFENVYPDLYHLYITYTK